MLFCCGDQLNVASLSGLTQQWEAPRVPPALPPQERGRREQLDPAHHNPGNADFWPFHYGINGCSARTVASWYVWGEFGQSLAGSHRQGDSAQEDERHGRMSGGEPAFGVRFLPNQIST
ncbi:hypothetical protein INR49_024255, partial [Caranx melampygus]